ncbi:MAG: electron transport complex subunit RsxC [Gammaproteobacteria bacterium]
MRFARRLWRFPGGLRLAGNKAMSLATPLVEAPLPERLILPLRQHIGAPAEPRVAVGQSVRKGEILAQAREYVSAPVHAPTSGRVVAIGEHPVPHPSGLSAPCIELAPDGEDRWDDGLDVPEDPSSLPAAELRARIRAAGIVGLGGAVFPSAVKLTPGPQQVIDTLVINGVECEPYITCDDTLMQTRPRDVVEGARVLRLLVGAARCILAVEDNKPQAAQALRRALTGEAAESNEPRDGIEVMQVPTRFPAGGEKQLIRVLTGREVPRSGLPLHIGVVCLNVGTTAAVYDAVFRRRPLISRIVTVTGPGVRRPRNLLVRLGTPLSHLIEQAGGYAIERPRLTMGGPMMGLALSDDTLPITKATNCVLVEPQPAAARTLPCIRCGACVDVCPVRLLPQQLYWFAQSGQYDKARGHGVFDCIECGCCAHVCPSNIPLVQYYRNAKSEIAAAERERSRAERSRQRHEMRQLRLEREQAARKVRRRPAARPTREAGQ